MSEKEFQKTKKKKAVLKLNQVTEEKRERREIRQVEQPGEGKFWA